MNRPLLKKSLNVFYALIIAALVFLFFTNDFGLVDLRKTSVVIGIGLDMEEGEVELTAQLAVPQPAENGENTQFNIVTGRGATVAAALNEVNVKTGFYPKLVFCKLIVLGESCLNEDVSVLLDYFYRNEYTGLTLSVAACRGKAGDLLAKKYPLGNSATDVIEKLLSSEAKASGNVSSVTIKQFGEDMFSQSAGSYMPYLVDSSEEEEGGEGGSSESSSGGSSEESSSNSSGQSTGGSSGGQKLEESLLTCNRCAVFSGGFCKGVLPVGQTFALNLIKNEVRHAFLKIGGEDGERVLGLRSCKGGADLSFRDDRPVLRFRFTATAKVQDGENGFDPETSGDPHVPDEILREGEQTLCKLFGELTASAKEADCDVFGAKTDLYRKYYKKYGAWQEDLLGNLGVECEVKLQSSG